MVNLGILNGEVEDLFRAGVHRVFMCHYLGHQLGLDVHDVGMGYLRGKGMVVKENMVLTVEPGI